MLIGAAFNAATDRRWPHRADDVTLDGVAVMPPQLPAGRAIRPAPEQPPGGPPPASAELLADAPTARRRAVDHTMGRRPGP